MTKNILTGLLLNEVNLMTVSELCNACKVDYDWILLLVDEGILVPREDQLNECTRKDDLVETWRFDGSSLTKALMVRRLEQQLGVNIAGAALALELMDENSRLRSRLDMFEL